MSRSGTPEATLEDNIAVLVQLRQRELDALWDGATETMTNDQKIAFMKRLVQVVINSAAPTPTKRDARAPDVSELEASAAGDAVSSAMYFEESPPCPRAAG